MTSQLRLHGPDPKIEAPWLKAYWSIFYQSPAHKLASVFRPPAVFLKVCVTQSSLHIQYMVMAGNLCERKKTMNSRYRLLACLKVILTSLRAIIDATGRCMLHRPDGPFETGKATCKGDQPSGWGRSAAPNCASPSIFAFGGGV